MTLVYTLKGEVDILQLKHDVAVSVDDKNMILNITWTDAQTGEFMRNDVIINPLRSITGA